MVEEFVRDSGLRPVFLVAIILTFHILVRGEYDYNVISERQYDHDVMSERLV